MIFLRIAKSPIFNKGVAVVNDLNSLKFHKFLQRIILKVAKQSTEIFTEEETQKLCSVFDTTEENLQLAVKTLVYVFKKTAKYVFMPNNLKEDLLAIGFNIEKAETMVKLWSAETKPILKDIASENDTFKLSWQLNAELSSVISKKSNVAKLHMKLCDNNNQENELEMTHSDLYSMFLQFEAIQNELDSIM